MAYILGKENGEAIPAISWAATLPTGFTDITTNIVELDCYVAQAVNYHSARKLMQAAVIAITQSDYVDWALLTDQEKDIAAKWIAAPYSLRITRVTDTQDGINWEMVLKRSREGRTRIVEQMRLRVGQDVRIDKLTLESAHDLYFSVTKKVEAYKNSAAPDLLQWLTNEVGSAYEFNGMAEKNYYTAQADHDQLVADLQAIYNGEFIT